MKQLNNLFRGLFIFICMISIFYIWKTEVKRENLESQIEKQDLEITNLKTQLQELKKNDTKVEDVLGISTITGKISGIVKLKTENLEKPTIVCAQDKFTDKEYCTDELTSTSNPEELTYSLDIPVGRYFIYAINPPDSEMTYYSKIQKCTSEDNCENDQKILLEINENEEQKDINIYF